VPELLKPPALRRGDIIGLIAPAGAIWDTSRIERCVRYLEGLGYRTEIGAHASGNDGAFAAQDSQRLADLNGFLRDPRVRAVFALRGGYGTPRLLSGVDYAAVRRDPKIVVGYSDLTALQLALFRRTRLVTFSGPLAAVELAGNPDPFTEEHFWRVITSRRRVGRLPAPADAIPLIGDGGSAEGPLLGGCLSLVCSLLGTPFLPSLRGAVLVFEDVHEPIHRLDRMFTQLRLAGVLPRAAGLVLGLFTKCAPADPAHASHTLEETLAQVCADADRPWLRGLAYGHVPRKVTLPLGVRARLNPAQKTLTVLESAVV
jgi:muramoyltetrapeptide carboxypeptidase